MVLEGYSRKGKYFTNPLESKLGGKISRMSSLDDIYPEIFWIYFIYKKIGLEKTKSILLELTKNNGFEGKISELSGFTKEKLRNIKNSLSQENLEILKKGLEDIIVFFQDCPLQFFYSDEELRDIYKKEQKISDILMHCLLELESKMSFGYIFTLGIFIENLSLIGKFKKSENVSFELNLTDFENNKDSKEHLSKYGGSLRAMSLMLIPSDSDESKVWKNYFWRTGIDKTSCYELAEIYGKEIFNFGESYPDNSTPQIKNHIKDFCFKIGNSLKNIIDGDLFKNYPYSLESLEKDQIICGLMNRQINLTRKILINATYWETEIVTILYRVLLENYLKIIWFNEKATHEESKYFIFQGIGNKKLYIEKMKELNKVNPNECSEKLIEKFETDLEKETSSILQDVDVSNPIKKDIRKMAEEIDKKLEHWVYVALSDTVHANWTFLSDKYLKPCTNPLHKRHMIPSNHQNYINFESPYMILSVMVDLLKYGKDKLKLNFDEPDIKVLEEEGVKFREIFLGSWTE